MVMINMQLFIKRDTTDLTSRFVVFDDLCKEKYHVVCPSIKSTGKLVVKTLSDEKIATIKEIPLPMMKAYSINDGKQSIKLIINVNAQGSSCYFYSSSWHFRGDILLQSYDIIDVDNSIIASNAKRFGKCGDGYELNITKDSNEALCLCVAICLLLVPIANDKAPQAV